MSSRTDTLFPCTTPVRSRGLVDGRACRLDRYDGPSFLSSAGATLFRRTAPVVRDRRHVDDVGDLVADVVERTYGRLSARTRTLDAHFQRLHAVVERGLPGLLGEIGRAHV